MQKIGFVSPVRQRIYEIISKMETSDFSEIRENLFAAGDAEISSETARIFAGEDFPPDQESQIQIANDCIRKMQLNFLQKAYDTHTRLAETYASLNDARYLEELKICNELRGKITNLYGN